MAQVQSTCFFLKAVNTQTDNQWNLFNPCLSIELIIWVHLLSTLVHWPRSKSIWTIYSSHMCNNTGFKTRSDKHWQLTGTTLIISAVQRSAGRPWTLTLTWMASDTNHLAKHACRSREHQTIGPSAGQKQLHDNSPGLETPHVQIWS